MHEMQTIVTNLAAHPVCVSSFGAAFAKLLWPLVN